MRNRLVQHDNWKTPDEIYNKLNEEFRFDFDPCPLNLGEITPDKDGLLIEWGNCNFVNPPYVRKLKEGFIRKAYQLSLKGKTSVLLIPVSTSTKIFHEIIYPNAEIRFFKGRINFLPNGEKCNKYNSSQMDSMLVIFRGKIETSNNGC